MSRVSRRPEVALRRAALRIGVAFAGSAVLAVAAGEWDAASGPATRSVDHPAQAPAPRRPRARATPAPTTATPPVETPAAAEAPAPALSARTIRLVDEARRPLVGEEIDFAAFPDATTDAAGEVAVVATTGTPVALTYDDGFGSRRVEVRDEFTEFVVATVDICVQTIDGFTGLAAANGGVAVRRDWSAEPEATEADSHGAALRAARTTRRSMRLRIATEGSASHAAAGDVSWQRPISITARRVRIDVPLFPLRTVELRPVNEDGEDVSAVMFSGAALVIASGAETDRGFRATAAGREGDAVLASVPRVPANFATFDLRSPVDEATDTVLAGRSGPLSLGALGATLTAEVPVVRVSAGLGGGRRGLSAGCGCGSGRETVPVNVRVLRRDGSPAPYVLVRAGYDAVRTEPDGTATVQCVGDEFPIHAAAHGFLPSSRFVRRASLAPDAVVEIVEAEPRRVRIVVVDGDDRPVPSARVFATLTAYGPPVRTIAQMDGDTEIGTPRTDADGALLLDVCDGTIRYDVSLAGAAAFVETDSAEVRVVLGATAPTAH